MAEKPFKPTPKRLRDARRKGKIPKSQILSQSVAALAVFILICGAAPFVLVRTRILLEYWGDIGADPVHVLIIAGCVTVGVVVPILVLGGIAGLVAELAQAGLMVSFEPLMPKAERVDPIKGLVRIAKGVRSLWLVLLRIGLASFVFGWFLYLLLGFLGVSSEASPPLEKGEAWYWTQSSALSLALVLVLVGLVEFGWRRHKHRQELGMTHYEYRREQREQDGDPHTKGFRRELHIALTREELVKRVRRSRVLIVERLD